MNTLKLVIPERMVDYYCEALPTNDCGFDVYSPNFIVVPAKTLSFKIDLMIRGAMFDNNDKNVGYMLVPRSSTGSKTPLRLSNSIGIIDPEYRGNLMVYVDNHSDKEFSIVTGQRLFQLVCFDGNPIQMERVESLDQTQRGDGGFGSTGI